MEMCPEKFVQVLKLIAIDNVLDLVTAQLNRPDGWAPRPEVKELAHWFSSLSPIDQQKIEAIIKMSADLSL